MLLIFFPRMFAVYKYAVLRIDASQSFNGINGNDLTFSEISFKRTSIKDFFFIYIKIIPSYI